VALSHLEARHIRQVQIEQDDVVIVQLAEIDPLFTEVSPAPRASRSRILISYRE
jgi:hypothetical protein